MTPKKARSKPKPSPQRRPSKRPAPKRRAPTPERAPRTRVPPELESSILPPIPLGHTGHAHPPIGMGLWALGRWTIEDEAQTKAALGRALERRVRWFDTAEVYGTGRSERLLGEVLARAAPRTPPVFLTTKVSWEHLRPSQVRAALLGSLQRLNRPKVDLYLVHAPDPHVSIAETMGALEALWKEGRVGAIGVSNFSVDELEAAARSLSETEVVANQVEYNLFHRQDGEEILGYCRRHQIVVEAYTPLARGVLAGRYLDGEVPPAEVRRFAHRIFEGDRFPEVVKRGRELRALAELENVPMTSLALHWLVRQGVAPIFGASRPDQVDQVLDAVTRRPSDEALDRADAIGRGALD